MAIFLQVCIIYTTSLCVCGCVCLSVKYASLLFCFPLLLCFPAWFLFLKGNYAY